MSKALTNMEDFLAKYAPGTNDRFENRLDRYTYLKKGIDYANSGLVLDAGIVQEYQNFGWDTTRQIKYPLIDKLVATINSGKLSTCEASVTEIDTAFGTVTSVFFNFEFTMKPADSYTNEVDYLNEYMTKYNANIRAWADSIDTLVATNVEGVANIYYPAALQTLYWPDNVAGDAFLIPSAEVPTMYNYLQGVMREMNWDTQTDRYDVIANSKHYGTVQNLAQQGAGNSTNFGYQFDNTSPFFFSSSTKVPLGEAISEAAVLMVPNTFGIWNVNAPDVKRNSSTTDGKDWATITDPMTGWEIGSLSSSKCINAESLESYQFYTGVSFVSTYNSNPAGEYSPIIKLEIGV